MYTVFIGFSERRNQHMDLGNDKYPLKNLRRFTGMSQKDFAIKVGVSDRTIWTYENELESLQKLDYSMLQKLASALGVKVDNIFLG